MSQQDALQNVEWKEHNGSIKPFLGNQEIIWAAQPGSQVAFLSCPVFEVLLEGNRGGGKTDSLLMSFARYVGLGYGAEWRGVLFRQSYPQLADVIAKSKKWFPLMFPGAKYNEAQVRWTFPRGEELFFRHMDNPQEYYSFHGHAYPWIGWEELTTWPDDKCYKVMMSCSRSTRPDMPRMIRSTTNPYGVGHNWVKHRFRLPVLPGRVVGEIIEEVVDGVKLPPRVAIHNRLEENKILLHADPGYKDKIRAAASNPAQLRAWLTGDWDIVAGGMFDDVWNPAVHIIPNIHPDMIPRGWKIDRSYDHGQSKPFSVGWWAQSNGEPIQVKGRTIGAVKGDVIRLTEWYGWCGQPNEGLRMTAIEIAKEIRDRESRMGISSRVKPGPADTSIFDDYEPGKSVAGDMERQGVRWIRADKTAGSRSQGWQQMRQMLRYAVPGTEGVREGPGLFVCENCAQFLRTVPVLPRDDKNLDDVDDDAEDHVADECRYRVRKKISEGHSLSWK